MSEPVTIGGARAGTLVQALEQLWEQGEQPDVGAFLQTHGPCVPVEIVAVLACDQWQRWHAGQRVPAEACLENFPELAAIADAALELIYGEFLVRQALGERPTQDEYLKRFPAHAAALREQFGLFQALEKEHHGNATPTDIPLAASATETAGPEPRDAGAGTVSYQQAPAGRRQARGLPVVQGYEIMGELGRGGMGVVYRARQIGLKRFVALKTMLSGAFAGTEERERFRREAEAVAQLRHPHIVQIYEIGEQNGEPFFSLEYMANGSLASKVRGEPQPPEHAAALVETVAQAMHHAHQRGIIHRDLKPANILIDDAGQPKITDFGLAKHLEATLGAEAMTQTGAILGTPSYMAPEQISRGKTVGPAADVYALGAILYDLLTGRPPFKGPTPMDTMMQVLSDEPVPPGRLQPRVPRDLETVCLKCLEKDAGRRYADCQALADDLHRWCHGEPIRARRVGSLERASKWCRKNRLTAFLLGAVAASLVLGSVAAWLLAAWALQEAGDARYQSNLATTNATLAAQKEKIATDKEKIANDNEIKAKKSAKEAWDALEETRKLRNKSEWKVYAGNIALAQVAWRDNDTELSYHHLNACRRDFRGWEHDYLWTLFQANQISLRGHGTAVTSVAFSPDGTRMLSGGADGSMIFWDASSGRPFRKIKGHTNQINSLVFSSDGQKIVSSGSQDKTVKVWDASSGKETFTFKGHDLPVMGAAITPDGRKVVSAAGKTIKIWDAATGKEFLELKHPGGIACLALSPDGAKIVSCASPFVLTVWDAASGVENLALKGHTGYVHSIAFSRDGKRIVSGGFDKTVKVWDESTGQVLHTLQGHTLTITSVAFSPDGRSIASTGWDQMVKMWDAGTGQEKLAFKGHVGAVRCLAFSPDGSKLVSGSQDGTLKLWPLSRGGDTVSSRPSSVYIRTVAFTPDGTKLVDNTVRVLDGFRGQVLRMFQGRNPSSIAVSPDGKRIISGGFDNTVKVLDFSLGQELLSLQGHSNIVNTVAISTDGTRIVSGSNDESIKVWDALSGAELLTIPKQGPISGVAFSPDGKTIASAGLQLKLWDASSGREILSRKGDKFVSSVAFSPDGGLIVGGCDKSLRIWDTASGEERATLEGHVGGALGVAFSPDGSRIVSGGRDGTVRVWDTATGQETITLKGHSMMVWSVAFSPDGKRIASGSHDGVVKIWDASMHQP